MPWLAMGLIAAPQNPALLTVAETHGSQWFRGWLSRDCCCCFCSCFCCCSCSCSSSCSCSCGLWAGHGCLSSDQHGAPMQAWAAAVATVAAIETVGVASGARPPAPRMQRLAGTAFIAAPPGSGAKRAPIAAEVVTADSHDRAGSLRPLEHQDSRHRRRLRPRPKPCRLARQAAGVPTSTRLPAWAPPPAAAWGSGGEGAGGMEPMQQSALASRCLGSAAACASVASLREGPSCQGFQSLLLQLMQQRAGEGDRPSLPLP